MDFAIVPHGPITIKLNVDTWIDINSEETFFININNYLISNTRVNTGYSNVRVVDGDSTGITKLYNNWKNKSIPWEDLYDKVQLVAFDALMGNIDTIEDKIAHLTHSFMERDGVTVMDILVNPEAVQASLESAVSVAIKLGLIEAPEEN